MTTRLPHYRKGTDASFIEAVMKMLPAAYEREILNLDMSSDRTPIFSRKYMDWMLDGRNLYQRYNAIDTIYVTVDPGAGRNQSEYAIMSMAFVPLEPYEKYDDVTTRCVVLGADAMRSNIAVTVAQVVKEHIEEVRRIPGLANVRCVVCPEANSTDADNVIFHLRKIDLHNVRVFTEIDSKGVTRNGQNTNAHTRKQMFLILEARIRAQCIVFHRDFCQASPGYALDESTRDIVITHLRNGYRKVEPPKRDGEKGRIIRTGKDPETGAQDDFLMCLAMGMLAHVKYLEQCYTSGQY
jgi:hypothetical protein